MADKELARVARNSQDTFIFKLTDYKGKKYADIRTYYTDDEGNLLPTKKGINIPIASFPSFLATFQKFVDGLVAEGVLDPEDISPETLEEYK
jgi:hypothetical protein